MSRTPKDVTDAELAVLRLLWTLEEGTVRALADRLYPGGRPSDHATVQKLLSRLESKGCVAKRRELGGNVYRAKIERAELIDRRLRATAEQLCEGSLTPLLTRLVRGGGLSAEDRRDLRRIVEELGEDER